LDGTFLKVRFGVNSWILLISEIPLLKLRRADSGDRDQRVLQILLVLRAVTVISSILPGTGVSAFAVCEMRLAIPKDSAIANASRDNG
jgi:hypothetical protein